MLRVRDRDVIHCYFDAIRRFDRSKFHDREVIDMLQAFEVPRGDHWGGKWGKGSTPRARAQGSSHRACPLYRAFRDWAKRGVSSNEFKNPTNRRAGFFYSRLGEG
ncbi:hypothetical protein BN2475_400012 [Paraburkholderia ribeironis]|uniref:Uncharacterized protein n=1 Tax=Paraburkholderia ribeironis TaxID=1247936 RepID=A0A1N7S6C1_9BURK|nr:hypothetical protein BN2475_400012 [Paraburkholderia ribeironis]